MAQQTIPVAFGLYIASPRTVGKAKQHDFNNAGFRLRPCKFTPSLKISAAKTSLATGQNGFSTEGLRSNERYEDLEEWFFTENGQKGWVDAMELNHVTPNLPQLLVELGARYDPDRLAAALSNRTLEINARAVTVATTLGGFVALLLQDYALGKFVDNMPKRAKQLRNILSRFGPAFVKVGQALSARPDLLPQPYLHALAELQDRLPSFPTSIAFTVIEEELGRPVEEIFSEITPEPVAAASLGQVYRARLRATGEVVAVKVQRPGIGENIAIDMLLLRRLMAAVDKNVTQVSQPLVPLVDEFAARLFGELDYIQEGRNCEKFQALYGSMPRVRTPAIYWDYTQRRVLVMEWIDGVKLTDFEAMKSNGLDVVDFVNVGVECTLRQLLEYGFFHADPHPGNLLAARNGDLVFLDFGMMSEAPQYARYAIIAHVVHLVNRDYLAMCRDYYTLEFMDPSVDTSPIAPALAEFFDDVLNQSVQQLNFKAIVDGLGNVLFQFPFRVPAYYALILRSLTVLEGLALSADINYKLLGRAYPYIAKRLLTDPAPELRQSFEEIILIDGRMRWSRLENLLREGSKSSDFDSSQLWLLLEWIMSDAGTAIRRPMADEIVRLMDALIADNVRHQIIERTGDKAIASQLIPEAANEAAMRERAHLLAEVISSRMEAVLPVNIQGQGPGGIPGPGDISRIVSQFQSTAVSVWPRLQPIVERPAALEVVGQLQAGLAQRFAARTIKLFAGLPFFSSNGSSTSSSSSRPAAKSSITSG